MKKTFILLFVVAVSLFAENLIINSDFSFSRPNLAPECRSNGGEISLHTEDLSWNKCGKLAVNQIKRDADGHETIAAAVWIGGGKNNLNNDNPGGFECKPDTVYQFSVDVRGSAPSASIAAVEWKSDSGLWHLKRLKSSVGGIAVQSEWTNYKGTFKTEADASHAALYLQLWANSKYGPIKFKVGDYILFDNVVVTEQKLNSLQSADSSKLQNALEIRKTISAANASFADFSIFKSKEKPSAETRVEVNADETGIGLKIDCLEPLQVKTAGEGGLWNGDVIEIFFGDKAGDRRLSQFVLGPDGRKFSGRGSGTDIQAEWTAETSIKANSWHATVHIPFTSLGWSNPEKGQAIAFNVARQRKAAKELQSWAPLKISFHDVEYFGSLLLGDYPDAMTREQYELAEAEKKAAALQEKFARNAQKTFLVAPLRITSDFSIPFLPDEVFAAPDKVALSAAINELKPLALAIANTTEKAVEYRVVLEAMPAKGENRFDWHDGRPFPGTTLRQGQRMRDSGSGGNALLDPLPKLNEASTMMVPAKEAGLLWIDFDTSGLKPGNYEGRIRIIPLNGKGVFSKAGAGYGNLHYDGEMTDFPFCLQIYDFELSKEPSIPGNFFSAPVNQEVKKLLREAGMRLFQINPWSLRFPLDKEGRFKTEAAAQQTLRSFTDLSKEKFFIGYSCYDTFLQLYPNKSELWSDWLKTVAEFMRQNGVDLQNCRMEVYDEPDPKDFEEILSVLQAAKKAIPEIKLDITLGARIMSAEQMEKLNPFVDSWTLWSHGYFRRPEHLAFIKNAQKQGKKIGHYTCDTAIRSSLDRNYRRNAWFGEYHQLDLNALYQGITGLKHCMWKGTPQGEILYHGADYAIPSIRYMAFRQGMTDVKYLAKLRELGKGIPEVEEFLKNAAKRVAVDFAHDPNMPDTVREEAAQLILKILK